LARTPKSDFTWQSPVIADGSLKASQESSSVAIGATSSLSNQDIVVMSQSNFDDSTVVKMIQAHNTDFDISVVALVRLSDSGVS
jgi:hypothetical protein